jgi:excisionase family DNA binding protein
MATLPNDDDQLETSGDLVASDVSARLLTAREVAAQLGVSCETVLRWTRSGKLPGFRMPSGALRYREADLDDWLAERATSATRAISREASAGGRRTVGRVSRSQHARGDQDAVDPARSGVQARLW